MGISSSDLAGTRAASESFFPDDVTRERSVKARAADGGTSEQAPATIALKGRLEAPSGLSRPVGERAGVVIAAEVHIPWSADVRSFDRLLVNEDRLLTVVHVARLAHASKAIAFCSAVE